ncbi:MAG: zinc ribbon domain-containing protein [Pirellulales bacterium]
MWIRLDCPNGHPVKVAEKFAGRMGRCPTCGEKVRIPQLSESQDISDDDVLNMIGNVPLPPKNKPVAAQDDIHATHEGHSPDSGDASSAISMSPATMAGSGAAALAQQTRICPSCKRKVSVRYQICPHCRTYMPITGIGAGETLLRGQPNITNCPHCGARSFPGANVCNNCGEPLT